MTYGDKLIWAACYAMLRNRGESVSVSAETATLEVQKVRALRNAEPEDGVLRASLDLMLDDEPR
jgi:hypothetical protein